MTKQQELQTIIDPLVLKRLLEAVASLRFGSVEITVHEGRVVQIDRRERIRIEKQQD